MIKDNYQKKSSGQLNPFEIKAEILNLISKLEGISDFENYEIHYRTLDAQNDKKIITKLLFKEINNLKDEGKLIKFLLKRYCEKQELIDNLWILVKSNMTSNQAKIFALDLLRDIDANWSYEQCDNYLENPNDFVDEDTKRLLTSAIVNPEVQIDFLDFLSSLPLDDKIILLKSLGEDYTKDELANILVPVFLSQPDSEVGRAALNILGNSKSQLAYHALNSAYDFVPENLKPLVKKNISILKLAGIREDNTIEFYKKVLENSAPYRFCITYPDGHGNIALILSRINNLGKVQFAAVVADDYHGIRDCFGFNEISQFECNTIIERFYKEEKCIEIKPETLKSLLTHSEHISLKSNNWLIPYEYVCWKNLLSDIDETKDITDTLTKNLTLKDITEKEVETITNSDFMSHWFLDEGYSDEFDEFLDVVRNSSCENFDKLIDENILKIFYKEEYNVWSERILTVSYIKLHEGLKDEAEILYSLYKNENMKLEFFKNIVRISIYQYYYNLKSQNVQGASDIVSEIERMWVNADV